MTGRHPLALAALLAGLGLAASRAGAQCSMCQSVVSQSPEAQAAAAQLNLAILVMFLAPYLVLGSLALLVFHEPLTRFVSRVAGRPLSR